MPFTPGEIVCERYEIEALLGVGSIGFVVSARRIDLGDKVALKFLRSESLANQELVARFVQEARVAASIKSEHIARVLDVGRTQDGSPFIVMEKLEGRDLGRVLSEGGPLVVPLAIEYACEVCEALAAAHSRGIVHRDIKPENLFLSELTNGENIVKVLDFGISKVALSGVIEQSPLHRTSVIVGSPVYMSPEQIRDSADVDARTDIWSLGCVLYELLSGSPAFDGQSLMQLCSVILEQWPTPLTALNPLVTAQLEAIVWRCLAKDPAQRFQNVADLARALGECSPHGAQIWVERCQFLLASSEAAPSSVRAPLEPSSSRGSLHTPPSSRRSVPPMAVALPDPTRPPSKFRQRLVVSLGCGLVLALAWLFRPVLTTGALRSSVGSQALPAAVPVPSSSAHATLQGSEAPSAAPSAATPSIVPAPGPLSAERSASSASSAPARPLAVQPEIKAAHSAARRPALTGAAKSKRSSTLIDDEPDVGF